MFAYKLSNKTPPHLHPAWFSFNALSMRGERAFQAFSLPSVRLALAEGKTGAAYKLNRAASKRAPAKDFPD